MLNYYEYKRKLNKMNFNNFLCDASNDEAYKRFLALADANSFTGNRILLSGPQKSGKAHLIVSLLDEILRENATLKIKKTNATDFLSHIIFEAHSNRYGFTKDSENGYVEQLLSNDVLVIEDINYINKQLADGCFTKKAFCEFLDRWNYNDKLLILTVDESHEGRIIDNEVLYRLAKFEKVFMGEQSIALIKRWLSNAVKLSNIIVDEVKINAIAVESKSIAYSRYLLLDYYLKHRSNEFIMTKPIPTVEQILDFALGKQDGYKRILDYNEIHKSKQGCRSTVYYLKKYTNMNCEEIASTLRIDVGTVKSALEEHQTLIEESERTKEVFEYMEEFMLDWEPNYYHVEGIKSANDD